MTFVVWSKLTMTLNNQSTAEQLLVKVLDQIYVTSPLPPATATTGPTNGPTG